MPALESQKWKQKKFRGIPAGKWGYLQKNRTQASLDSETSRQRNQVMNSTPAKSLCTCRPNRIASVHVHGFRKSVTPYYWHVLFMCVHAHEHMEVTGQLVDVHSLPLSCDCQGPNLGHRAWQEPLGDISMPYFNFLLFINNKYKHMFFWNRVLLCSLCYTQTRALTVSGSPWQDHRHELSCPALQLVLVYERVSLRGSSWPRTHGSPLLNFLRIHLLVQVTPLG